MPRLVVLVVGSSVHRDLSWSSVLASVADQLARALPPAMVQTTFIACLARLAPLIHFRGCMSSTFVCLGTVANCAFPQIGTIRRHLRFQYVVWVGFHEIYLLIVHVVVLSGFLFTSCGACLGGHWIPGYWKRFLRVVTVVSRVGGFRCFALLFRGLSRVGCAPTFSAVEELGVSCSKSSAVCVERSASIRVCLQI